jgi:hypothetical protein
LKNNGTGIQRNYGTVSGRNNGIPEDLWDGEEEELMERGRGREVGPYW